jgi:preprotein translocase subunit SecD
MLNQNPLYRWLLFLSVVLTGSLYALPNVFGEQPAIQVSRAGGANERLVEQVNQIVSQAGYEASSVALEDGLLLARFENTDQQLAAADVLREELSRDHVVALNMAPRTPEWLRGFGAEPMSLGLDLRGGVHFLMEVDMDEAIDRAMEKAEPDFKKALREARIRYRKVEKEKNSQGFYLQVELRDEADWEQASALLEEEFPVFVQPAAEQARDLGLSNQGNVFILSVEEQERLRKMAIEQNVTTLRNRVNELGVSEPLVQQQGKNRIVVELPGVQDTAQAKDLLKATATLEFRMVDEDHDAATAARRGRAPAGTKLYETRWGAPILLKRDVIVDGTQLTDAAATIEQDSGRPAVRVTLDSSGAKEMGKTTKDNVGNRMAVVFIEYKSEIRERNGEKQRFKTKEEEVINAASIREPFSKNFIITGLEHAEASNLARLLRAGALAAPIYIVEERTVGPSLGAENVKQGFTAVAIGFLLVVIFMVIYYRAFGLIANMALFINLVMIIGVMSLMQATLTLPGIAGIVLTVGMAVDANVLIFERIREEIRAGTAVQTAIHAGYEKAFSTIADANVTTLIAAVVLFAMGSGPIKGFAVTLAIGIATSMFTAIVGTRLVVNAVYGGRDKQTLPV